MIHGRKNIIEWFKSNGKPYFSIFRKTNTDTGNTVFTNKEKEGETMETAAAYLEQCLSLIHSGDFFIFCWKEGGSTSKGRSETYFTLSSGELAIVPQQQHMVAGFADYEKLAADSDRKAEEKFQSLMLQYEMKQLKEKAAALEKENKELNAAAAKPWNKIVGEIAPYIGNIAEQLGFKATAPIAQQLAVSGTPHDEHLHDNANEAESKMSEVAQLFLEALAQRYPDTWLTILQQLTSTLQTSPEKIDMALKFL